MRKRRAGTNQTAALARSNSRRAFVAAGLALTMLIGSVILAQRRSPQTVTENHNKPGESGITVPSLDTPSKEYIYAGGKLIATEEPPSSGPGSSTTGLYDPVNSSFFLKNANTSGVADLSFFYDVTFIYGPGGLGWQVITGDWDGW